MELLRDYQRLVLTTWKKMGHDAARDYCILLLHMFEQLRKCACLDISTNKIYCPTVGCLDCAYTPFDKLGMEICNCS